MQWNLLKKLIFIFCLKAKKKITNVDYNKISLCFFNQMFKLMEKLLQNYTKVKQNNKNFLTEILAVKRNSNL